MTAWDAWSRDEQKAGRYAVPLREFGLLDNNTEEFLFAESHLIRSVKAGIEFGSWIPENYAVHLQTALFHGPCGIRNRLGLRKILQQLRPLRRCRNGLQCGVFALRRHRPVG